MDSRFFCVLSKNEHLVKDAVRICNDGHYIGTQYKAHQHYACKICCINYEFPHINCNICDQWGMRWSWSSGRFNEKKRFLKESNNKQQEYLDSLNKNYESLRSLMENQMAESLLQLKGLRFKFEKKTKNRKKL
jgi:hypothetical protein